MTSESKQLLVQHLLQPQFFSKATAGASAFANAAVWAQRSRIATLCEAVDRLKERVGMRVDGSAGVRAFEFIGEGIAVRTAA